MRAQKGFTLIELMVVVSMIGILASVALPQYRSYIERTELVEALSMASTIREDVTHYYVENLEFPTNNKMTGIPEARYLIANSITSVTVEKGAFHIVLGNKVPKPLQGKTLSFRPAVVVGSPTSPISWLCGYDEAIEGMQAVGNNKTDIDETLLPSACSNRML